MPTTVALPRRRPKKIRRGQKLNRRVDWYGRHTKCAMELAQAGIAMKRIAKATGLTTNQVQYRMSRIDIKLRGYRNGKGKYGEVMIKRFTIE